MKPTSQSDRAAFQKWIVSLFVLVVAVFGIVQAVHVHDGLATDEGPGVPAAHCLICVSAHSAPIVTTVSLAPVLAHTATITPVLDPQLHPQLEIFSAFIRPPPQAL